MRPYVILDQPGEAYLDPEKKPRTTWYEKIEYRQWKLFARAAAGVDLSGRLVLPRPAYDGMQAIRFTLPASQASKSDREAFLAAEGRHFQRLLLRGVPGGAWFRERLRQNRRQLHPGVPDSDRSP